MKPCFLTFVIAKNFKKPTIAGIFKLMARKMTRSAVLDKKKDLGQSLRKDCA